MALSEVDLTPLPDGIRNPSFVKVGALDGATPALPAREPVNAIPCVGAIEIPAGSVQAVEEFLLRP